MKNSLFLILFFFTLACNCNPEQLAVCDYHLDDLKNYLYDVQVDGQGLNGNAAFSFPYLAHTQGLNLEADLNAWLGGDGVAAFTYAAGGGLIIDISGTSRIFETLTVSGLPDGTHTRLFTFEQSNCQ